MDDGESMNPKVCELDINNCSPWEMNNIIESRVRKDPETGRVFFVGKNISDEEFKQLVRSYNKQQEKLRDVGPAAFVQITNRLNRFINFFYEKERNSEK